MASIKYKNEQGLWESIELNGKTPTIGKNGNWFIGDIDTGKPSKGKDGIDGKNGISLGEISISTEIKEGEMMKKEVPSTDLVAKAIKKSSNEIFVDWLGSDEETKMQIKESDRKKGLILSYIEPNKGLVSQVYTYDYVYDIYWKRSENWKYYGVMSDTLNEDLTLFSIADDSVFYYNHGDFPNVFMRNVGIYINNKVLVLSTSSKEPLTMTTSLNLPYFIPNEKLQDPNSIDLTNYIEINDLKNEKGKCIVKSIKDVKLKTYHVEHVNANTIDFVKGNIISGKITISDISKYVPLIEVGDNTVIEYDNKEYKLVSGTYTCPNINTDDRFRANIILYIDIKPNKSFSDVFELKLRPYLKYDEKSSNLFGRYELPFLELFSENGQTAYSVPKKYINENNKNIIFVKEDNNRLIDFKYNNVSSNVNIIDLGAIPDANYSVYDYESIDEASPKFGKEPGWYVDEECTIPSTDNSFIFKNKDINSLFIPKGNFFIKTNSEFVSNVNRIQGLGKESCLCSVKPNWQGQYDESFVCKDVRLINLGNTLSPSHNIYYDNCFFEFYFKASYGSYMFSNSGKNIIRNCSFTALNRNFCMIYLDESHDSIVENCKITTPASGRAISFAGNVNNIIVKNCEIHNYGGITNIFTGSNRNGASKNITIEDNKIFGATEESISFDGFGNNTELMPPIAHTKIIGKVYLPSVEDGDGNLFKRIGFKLSKPQKWAKIGEGQFDWGYADMTDEEINKYKYENYIWYVSNSKNKGLNGEILKYDTSTSILETNICDSNDSILADGSEELEILAGGFNITIKNNYIRGNYGNGTDLTWSSGTGVCVYMGVINALVEGNRIEGLPKAICVCNLSGENAIPVFNDNIRVQNNYVVGARMTGMLLQSFTVYNMSPSNIEAYGNSFINCKSVNIEGIKCIKFINNSLKNTPIIATNSGKIEYLPNPSNDMFGQKYTVFKYSDEKSGTIADNINEVVCLKNENGNYIWREIW